MKNNIGAWLYLISILFMLVSDTSETLGVLEPIFYATGSIVFVLLILGLWVNIKGE